MKKFKVLALIMALALAVSLLAGCGGGGSETNTPAPAQSAAPADESAAPVESSDAPEEAGFTPKTVPAVPDLGGMTSNEWLLSREDKLPLGGIVPDQYEHRTDVYKGLDQVDLNDDHVVVGWLSASLGSPYFVELTNSAKARCEEYGYEFINFDANFDLTTQIEQVENILTQDIDFLLINATDIDALSLYYKQAAEMGIPVFVEGPTAAKDDYNIVTCILSNSWDAGFVNGVYTVEQTYGSYPEGAKLGTLITKCGDAFCESRICGYISGYLYKYAEMSGQPYDSKWDAAVIGYNAWLELRDNGSSDDLDGILNLVGYTTTVNIATSSAQPACADLLTAHPDIDIAFVETDSFGLAMVNECRQMGIEPGKDIVIVYAADGLNTICDAIKEGSVLSMGANSPYPCGEGIVDLIHDIMNGYDANDIPANVYLPTYAITKDNVDEVLLPGATYTKLLEDWSIQTVDEYNAAHANG